VKNQIWAAAVVWLSRKRWSKWLAALGWRHPAGTSSLSTLGGSRADGLLGVCITGLGLGEEMSVCGLVFIMEGNNDVVVISENNPMKTNAKQKKSD
jgi:hypothetical protein